MAGLTWLHLSDWHQKGKEFDRDVVRDALLKDIRGRAERIHSDLTAIDFVVFSGDAAFFGKGEDYRSAIEQFFNPVLEAAGISREQLFIVPGNHDLDRSTLASLPEDLWQELQAPGKIGEWLTGEDKRRTLLQPMNAYSQFITEYLGKNIAGPEPVYGYVRQFTIRGRTIALIGLNSAWLSARHTEMIDGKKEVNDYGYLILGEPQVHEALDKAADADIRIAVLHHPFDWLTTTDTLAEKSLIRGRLSRACHFIVHGHEHEPGAVRPYGTAGDCVVISAGASYDRREPTASRYANGYNFVHLDFETGRGTVYLRRYEDRQGWIRDTGTTGDATPGYFEFPLPKALGETGPDSAGAPMEASSPRADTLASRPVRMNFAQKADLVNALLACAAVSDRNSRDTIVADLRPNLHQLDFRQKAELVEALLMCAAMNNHNTRDTLVRELPDSIRSTLVRSPIDRVDVQNIVNRCLDYPTGLEQLVAIVRFHEKDSIGMQKVDKIIASMQRTDLASRIPTTPHHSTDSAVDHQTQYQSDSNSNADTLPADSEANVQSLGDLLTQITEPFIRMMEEELRMNRVHWDEAGFEVPNWSESFTSVYFSQQASEITRLRSATDVLYNKLESANLSSLQFFDFATDVLTQAEERCCQISHLLESAPQHSLNIATKKALVQTTRHVEQARQTLNKVTLKAMSSPGVPPQLRTQLIVSVQALAISLSELNKHLLEIDHEANITSLFLN